MMIDVKANVASLEAPSRFARRPDIATANLGAELAVLDLPSGTYLGFNATAAHLWRLLSAPQTLDALCESMVREFEIDEVCCREEVSALMQRLLAAGLVRQVDGELA